MAPRAVPVIFDYIVARGQGARIGVEPQRQPALDFAFRQSHRDGHRLAVPPEEPGFSTIEWPGSEASQCARVRCAGTRTQPPAAVEIATTVSPDRRVERRTPGPVSRDTSMRASKTTAASRNLTATVTELVPGARPSRQPRPARPR